MPAPISQRILGITAKLGQPGTVEELVRRLRDQTPGSAESGQQRVIVAQQDDTVADAYKLFKNIDLHHLPIVSGATVVGIVSSTDLLDFFATTTLLDPNEERLREIMTPDPKTLRKDAPVSELIHTLANSPFRCLPIVSGQDEIWDIVTTRDLVRWLELVYT